MPYDTCAEISTTSYMLVHMIIMLKKQKQILILINVQNIYLRNVLVCICFWSANRNQAQTAQS